MNAETLQPGEKGGTICIQMAEPATNRLASEQIQMQEVRKTGESEERAEVRRRRRGRWLVQTHAHIADGCGLVELRAFAMRGLRRVVR